MYKNVILKFLIQIEEAWTRIAGTLSIIYTKDLPYGIFMRQIVNEMTEKGQLHQLTKKWELKLPNCKPLRRKGTPLSFGKLTTLFLEISLGVLLTLILLFAEKIYSFYRPADQQHCLFKKHHANNVTMKIILKDIKECLQKRNINDTELMLLMEKIENKLQPI